MAEMIGKPWVFIPVLLAFVVLAVIYVPKLGQLTLKWGPKRSRSSILQPTARPRLAAFETSRSSIYWAILEPVFGNAFGVGVQLQPDERVTGVSINGESHAYPLNLMSRHEVVYDTVGGEPIAVTW